MEYKEYFKKVVKKDPIVKLFCACIHNDKLDIERLEKYLKKLVKQGKLLN